MVIDLANSLSLSLSIAHAYNIDNISNISVILLAPFADFATSENIRLSQLRNFENVSVYFCMRLSLVPKNYSKLKTRTFLFLKDGTQQVIDLSSPILKTL